MTERLREDRKKTGKLGEDERVSGMQRDNRLINGLAGIRREQEDLAVQ